ncbi:hypothetical protein NAMH_1504 [Nautilia profundicola AmH]|uniref:Uncharacterized protein n=1 Tax=Nautilia profundicola (strain ATCC BAA-1463 / DSM 18972 / AmH) TaxID=598659 RepID=B9L6A6_NAUPA|nr:hypothetical protein [Nautilia profundicola]ACM92762.1 hypothetical protein NAMH_1504 [Nautilia profundicola AmH]
MSNNLTPKIANELIRGFHIYLKYKNVKVSVSGTYYIYNYNNKTFKIDKKQLALLLYRNDVLAVAKSVLTALNAGYLFREKREKGKIDVDRLTYFISKLFKTEDIEFLFPGEKDSQLKPSFYTNDKNKKLLSYLRVNRVPYVDKDFYIKINDQKYTKYFLSDLQANLPLDKSLNYITTGSNKSDIIDVIIKEVLKKDIKLNINYKTGKVIAKRYNMQAELTINELIKIAQNTSITNVAQAIIFRLK